MPKYFQRVACDPLVIGSQKGSLILLYLWLRCHSRRCHSRRSRLRGCGPCGSRYEACDQRSQELPQTPTVNAGSSTMKRITVGVIHKTHAGWPLGLFRPDGARSTTLADCMKRGGRLRANSLDQVG